MRPNVFIVARDRGKIVYRWEGHNTWTDHGRDYVRSMLGLSSLDPDIPIIPTSRIKYLAFGVGGNRQSEEIAAVDAAYPPGFDPHATSGNEYDCQYPIEPTISTLERPVRLSGGTNPYNTAAPSDIWLTDPTPPKFLTTAPTPMQRAIRYLLSGPSGDMAYAPFTTIPISEMGIVLSGDGNINAAYNPIIAYINFDTLSFTATMEAEFEWIIQT